jgi:hypothetical protein
VENSAILYLSDGAIAHPAVTFRLRFGKPGLFGDRPPQYVSGRCAFAEIIVLLCLLVVALTLWDVLLLALTLTYLMVGCLGGDRTPTSK